jgi:hypothetical protein
MLVENRCYGLSIDHWFVDAQVFTEIEHPDVILEDLLATSERAPWDQLMHIGVSGVVTDLCRFRARPGWCRNNMTRLCLYIAETDLVMLKTNHQMHMTATTKLGHGTESTRTIEYRHCIETYRF